MKTMKNSFKNKYSAGFTFIELLVAVAIIAVLSAIILFTIIQYIDKGKDANVKGNLAILISSGEVYYNNNQNVSGTGYDGYCDSSVVSTAESEIPKHEDTGIYCSDNESEWAACAQLFLDDGYAYCVDSRGVKKEIDNDDCVEGMVQCP
jgi:Tfp pilus assembly protein PilE